MPTKAIVQLLAAALAAAAPAITESGDMTWSEWVNVGILSATAANVYLATNHRAHSTWKYTKAIVSSLAMVGVVVVSTVSEDTLSAGEIGQIVVAILGTAGVAAVPPDAAMLDTTYGRHARRDGP